MVHRPVLLALRAPVVPLRRVHAGLVFVALRRMLLPIDIVSRLRRRANRSARRLCERNRIDATRSREDRADADHVHADRAPRRQDEAGHTDPSDRQPRRILAASGVSDRCRHELPALRAARADRGTSKIRRAVPGRRIGGARGQSRGAQPLAAIHGLFRTDHAAVGDRAADHASRPGGDRDHQLPRAVQRGACICVARSYQRRARRMERGDLGEPRRGVQFRRARRTTRTANVTTAPPNSPRW